MKVQIVCVALLGLAPLLGLGCGSSNEIIDIDPNIKVLEKVETLSTKPLPEWALVPDKYKDKQPDTEYFVGIGFPRQTLVFVMHSASERAYASIAKYIGQVVAVKWQSAGEAKNLHGQQSIETVVEEFVQKTIAIARVQRAKLVETHVERVLGHHHGTGVEMNRVYQLYAVAKSDLVGTGKDSAARAAEEIQQERDEVRKEQLKKLEEVLKNLSTKDFEL